MNELWGTIFVSIGIFVSSFFSYLLQYFSGKYLSIAEYGNFNALLSLSYIVGVPAGVLATSLIKAVSDLNAKGEYGYLTRMFIKLSQLAVVAGICVFLFIGIFSGWISNTLKIFDVLSVLAFGLSLSTTLLVSIPQSYLQGILRYKAYAFYITLTGFLRFAFCVTLIFLGFGTKGSFTGIFLSSLVSYAVASYLLKKNLNNFEKISVRGAIKNLANFALPVLVINLCMMVLNNIDLILVKNYFDPQLAGYYAGTVTLGKILLFGAGSITIIMFPKIATLHTKGEDVSKIFKLFFILQTAIVGFSVLVFSLLPKLITMVFFGEKFSESIKYLPLFSIFIGLYVLINFMVMFMLAIGKTSLFKILIPGILLQIGLIICFHHSLYEVMYSNIVTVSIVLAFLLFQARKSIIEHKPDIVSV